MAFFWTASAVRSRVTTTSPASFADSTAASSPVSAILASPPATSTRWSSASSSTLTGMPPRPRSSSSSARSRSARTSDGDSGSRRSRRQRDRSGVTSEKYGFSVVAPIRVIVPSLHRGQQYVLLGLAPPVDLVDEQDRPEHPALRPLHDLARIGHPRGHGRELHDLRPDRVGQEV